MPTGYALLGLILLAIGVMVLLATVLKWHPFLALLTTALLTGLLAGVPAGELAGVANDGFGNMMKKIGLIVILGTLIGTILEKSGAIVRLSNAVLNLFGKKRPIAAITVIGAVVGVPIFCDSGFVILSGIARPLARQSCSSYSAIVCGLASGLYITHTLLPPHPGSIAGAANLGLKEHLGVVMGVGFLIAVPVSVVAWWFASKYAAKVQIETNDATPSALPGQHAPQLWKCILPVLVPVILIACASFMVFINLPLWLKSVVVWIGNPVMALLVGLLLSMLVVPKGQFAALRNWMKEGVEHAGTILVIVGAGGVFGEVLKHTSLADLVTSFSHAGGSSKLMFLLVAWTMGVLLKTAQGSTTSAIIVVTSIIAPLAAAAGFTSPLQLSLLLAAVAGGTMMVSHTNDAYFWVIAQFGGLDMNQTYKTFSLATVAMSVSVLILVMLLALALGLGNS